MKQLAILLNDFNFECIGTAQTDDENVICESLKRFGAIIGTIEDEREKMVGASIIYLLYTYYIHSIPYTIYTSHIIYVHLTICS